jgi:LDH2 family malate/lactate/ureidoglycolate dehydrogenase
MPGVSEVRYPGLNGHRTEAERRKSGIAIRPAFAAALDKLAAGLGVAPLTLM